MSIEAETHVAYVSLVGLKGNLCLLEGRGWSLLVLKGIDFNAGRSCNLAFAC